MLQKEILRRALELGANGEIAKIILSNNKFIVVRAPAGLGKTVTASIISLLLASEGKRVAIFVRTHAEMEHVLNVMKRLFNVIKAKLLVIPLFGKGKMCMFTPEEQSILKWWCTISQCYFLNKRRDEALIENLTGNIYSTLNGYYELAKDNNLCPYHFYVEASKKADVVIATHNYFIEEELFEKIKPIDVAVIDEAHSLVTPNIKEISKKEYGVAEKLLLKYAGQREDRFAKKLWEDGEKKVVSAILKFKEFEALEGIKVDVGDRYIKVRPINNLLQARMENIEKIIMMSATMYPEKFYRKIFSVDKLGGEFRVVKGLIESEKREVLVLLSGLTTSFKKRGKETIKKYVAILKTLSKALKEPILAFTPNKKFALEISTHVGLYIEGGSLTDLKDICNRVKSKDYIFVTYARSPLSEGIELNLGNCEPRIAAILGLPYPKLGGIEKKILSLVAAQLGVGRENFINAFLLSNMLSTIVQCLGRIGRTQKGVGIIIDDRIMHLNIPKLKMFRDISTLSTYVKNYLTSGN